MGHFHPVRGHSFHLKTKNTGKNHPNGSIRPMDLPSTLPSHLIVSAAKAICIVGAGPVCLAALKTVMGGRLGSRSWGGWYTRVGTVACAKTRPVRAGCSFAFREEIYRFLEANWGK